jgi:LysM repeat protein
MAPITSLEQLIKILQTAVVPGSPQTLTFGGALFDEANDLVQMFQPGATSITITQGAGGEIVQPNPPTNVVVAGTAVLFTGGKESFDYDVTITCTVPAAGGVQLVLVTAAATEGWTFAGNFAELPDYIGLTDGKPGPLPSFFNDISLSGAIFTASNFADSKHGNGLNFAGSLDATTGSLASLAPYLPNPGAIPTSGPITIRPATFPLIALSAPTDLQLPKIGGFALALGTSDAAGSDPALSTADLAANIKIGFFNPLTLTGPVLQGDIVWVLTVNTDRVHFSLKDGLSALVKYVNNQQLTLPAGLDQFSAFQLAAVKISLKPGLPPTVLSIAFGVSVAKNVKWVAPILGLGLQDLAIAWQVATPFSGPSLTGDVSGTLLLAGGSGEPPSQLLMDVSLAKLPDTPFATDVTVTAKLDPDVPVQVDQLFRNFTGLPLGINLQITTLDLEAHTGPRTLTFDSALQGSWPFPVPLITFGTTAFHLEYKPNAVSGFVTADVTVGGLTFDAKADHAAGAGWKFTASLAEASQGTTLQTFVNNLAGGQWPSLPAGLGNITLKSFNLAFDTAEKTFGFDGAVTWPFQLAGISSSIDASIVLNGEPDPEGSGTTLYSGTATGQLTIGELILGVVYAWEITKSTSITFQLNFRGATLTGVYDGVDSVEVTLTGVTFGEILEYLIGFVSGTSGFQLSSPWNALNSINFDNLTLTIGLKTKNVSATYNFGSSLDLGFISLKKITLAYVLKGGERTVTLAISGTFFGTTYGDDSANAAAFSINGDPLEWDVLNDPPPSPPGQGEQLLDLRFLALGQSVTFADTKSFTNVGDVIEAMEAEFEPVADDGTNPLATLSGLKFSGDGSWLIGADFTLIGAVAIAGVFNDPVLYGIRIGLAGPKVKSLSGLQLEILYKKVTDTIGLYHTELTLPDAMRQLQFGAVSVTVPIITIDIYTNGNFRLDFGFPTNGDFTRSFSLQAGPFIGYGGFYFALLDGSTSTNVPQITNGNFTPVIEFGLGISAGLGRTFDKGVLSAGISITMQAIVQGTLGWFNPNDSSVGTALFYRIQGTASLVGELYGKVDFVVIKIDVHVLAKASITLLIEAYQPIQVNLDVTVEVEASIKILFITVSFSFQTSLNFPFTIGSASTPPWMVASGSSSSASTSRTLLRGQRTQHALRPVTATNLFRAVRAITGDTATFDWSPRPVFSSIQPVSLLVTPALTVALPHRITNTLLAAAGATGPAVQVVMALFTPNAMAPGARNAREVVNNVIDDGNEASFSLLAEGMLRWALSSLKSEGPVSGPAPAGTVTAGQLDAISCFLADREKRDAVFTYPVLAQLISDNFKLQLSSPVGPDGKFYLGGSDQPLGATAEAQAAIFPMIPALRMAPQGLPPVEFDNHSCVTPAYKNALETYYDQLRVNPNAPPDPSAANPCGPVGFTAPSAPAVPGCAPGTESLASVMFGDYFALLTKQAVQNASDLLHAYPYQTSGASGPSGMSGQQGETLDSIEQAFGGTALEYQTRANDSVATIAAAFRVTIATLRAKNPWLQSAGDRDSLHAGSFVVVPVGPTIETIAAANQDYPLNVNLLPISIDGVHYQVKSGDTLTGIAQSFGMTGPGDILNVPVTAENPVLPQAGGKLAIPPQQYLATATDITDLNGANPLALVAARFFIRTNPALGPAITPQVLPWYTGTLTTLNPGTTLNPSMSGPLTVPIAAIQNGSITQIGTATYTPVPSDTVPLIAATLALLQLDAANALFNVFTGSITFSPPLVAGSPLIIPALPYTLPGNEAFSDIANHFFLDDPIGRLPALAWQNGQAPGILAPLAAMSLPKLSYRIATGDTLATVARKFNLTLDQLAHEVKDIPGLFQPYAVSGVRLSIPSVASRKLDTLIADLKTFGRFNSLSAMASRFLMHGSRVPQPESADSTLFGLYDVIGQQFPFPPGVSGAYDIVFTKDPAVNWIEFEAVPGQRRLAGPAGSPDSLTVPIGPSYIAAHSPALVLDPQINLGPSGMQLYRDLPPRYSLEQNIHWQSSTTIALGPTGAAIQPAGEPSLWIFPDGLVAAAEAGPTGPIASTPPYELLAITTKSSGTTEKELSAYSWATAVPIRIRRASDSSLPNAYLVVGADQAGRDLLLGAWRYLESAGPNPNDEIYILYSPSGASDNPRGLASDDVSQKSTVVLKTNLSTLTHSNERFLLAAAAGADDGKYYAGISTPESFLKYIWEASITGTGGFYLNYANSGGGGLPVELFASNEVATITLLLILGVQSAPHFTDRTLHRFTNCAVIAENLDSAAVNIVAQLAAPTPNDLSRVATVDPGLIGFEMRRINPVPEGPEGLTRSLYGLVGYEVMGNSDFAQSHEGLPVGPLENAAGATGATGYYWHYRQAIPVAQFGFVNDVPSSTALPPAAANPYRGVTGPGATGSTERRLSAAKLSLAFHDVYGNDTDSTQPLKPFEVPVGYTDNLIGVSSWPAAGYDFLFSPGGTTGTQLDTLLSLQYDRYISSTAVPFDQAVATATADAARYRQIFYQVYQHDLAFSLQSNIGTPGSDTRELKAALDGFVVKSALFTGAAAQLKQQVYQTPATGSAQTFGAIATTLGVTPAGLAGANAHASAGDLFLSQYVKPHIVNALPLNTLTKLVDKQNDSGPFPPLCTPAQSATLASAGPAMIHGLRLVADAGEARSFGAFPRLMASETTTLSVVTLATNNQFQPLTPGITLRTLARTATLPAFDQPGTNNLNAVAASLQTNVYAEVPDPTNPLKAIPIGLLQNNLVVPNLIAPGLTITIGGISVPTDGSTTFQKLYDAFASLNLTTAAFAKKIAAIEGIFQPSKTVTYADVIVPPASRTANGVLPIFSLASLPPAAGTIADLAPLNQGVPSFYFASTPIFLNFTCERPQTGDTLESLARDASVTLDQFAAFNTTSSITAGVTLTVPDLTYFADTANLHAGYAPTAADSLQSIATTFGDLQTLGDLNAEIPSIFKTGAPIVLGTTINATAADSLQSVFAQFQKLQPSLTFKDFITGIASLTGIYRTDGVVVVPFPRATAGSINELAKSLNIDGGAAALLGANRSLQGFLAGGATVKSPAGNSITVGAYDTVETIVRRFQQQFTETVTLAGLVTVNGDTPALLTVGGPVLLPPAASRFVTAFTPQIPPAGSSGESSVIFPVDVDVKMTRAPGLVNPDFIGSKAVYTTTSNLVPRMADNGINGITMEDFAEQFELAFQAIPLKCATSKKGTNAAAAGESRTRRLFAVNFGPSGISRVAVRASSPLYYALEPLSTSLISRGATFPAYYSGSGLCGTTSQNFQSVDVDSWMQQFLGTVDLFLTPPYSVPAFQYGVTGPVTRTIAPFPTLTSTAALGPVGLSGMALGGVGATPAIGPSGCTSTVPYGPSDYDTIVAAKNTIAGALRDRVGRIVNAPGATAYYDQAAREALYQQVLISLSDGYAVSAVVQFPVAVGGPFTGPVGPNGSTAPRLSGKLVPALYTLEPVQESGVILSRRSAAKDPEAQAGEGGGSGLPAGPGFNAGVLRRASPTQDDTGLATREGAVPVNTIASVASNYNVSPAFLAQVLGGVRGLLKAGVQVLAYKTTGTDTINDAASGNGVAIDPTLPGYWAPWSQFVASIALIPLFKDHASFPLSAGTRPIYGGETLSTFADFFNRDVATVARANDSVAGLVAAGSQVRLFTFPDPKYTYTVPVPQSLEQVLTGLNALLPAPATLDDLAFAIAVQPLLVSGLALNIVEQLPDMSLSTSKLSLGTPLNTPEPPLSFLLTVKNESDFQKILLNLDFVINEVEYDIADVPGAGSYQSSSWLTFVLPIGSGRGVNVDVRTDVAQLQVPLPLRSYPLPPSLVSQSGLASSPNATDIADARKWDYRFDFSVNSAAQDTEHVSVTFSNAGSPRLTAFIDREDLFVWLAAFITADPLLKNDLALLASLPPGGQNDTAAYAVQSLATIAGGVARSLAGGGLLANAARTSLPGGSSYRYQLRTFGDGNALRTLQLIAEAGMSGPAGPTAVFPGVFVKDPQGGTGGTGPDAGYLMLTPSSSDPGLYIYPPDIAEHEQLTYRFLFPNRDVIDDTDGWGGLYVNRNARLVANGPLGATGSTGPISTNPAFVYQTPLVKFIDPMTPLLDDPATIDISTLGGPTGSPAPLSVHLTRMLNAVLGDPPAGPSFDNDVLIVCNYGFVLAGTGDNELLATTPIRLLPTTSVGPSSEAAVVADLALSLTQWKEMNGVANGVGRIVFEVTVFSEVSVSRPSPAPTLLGVRHPAMLGSGITPLRPILRLRNLQLPLSAITWR